MTPAGPSSLVKGAALAFAILVLLVCFSRFSMAESATGAHAKKQAGVVCRNALKRAQFYADASEQDEALVLAMLHSCEAKAHSQAAKDLADRTGVVLEVDALVMIDEQQDRLDALLRQLQEALS